MNISVTGDELALEQQTRAYGEYRTFSALVPFVSDVDEVRVVLSSTGGDHSRRYVTCIIEATFRVGEIQRVRGRALNPYVAIDRATQRLRRAVERRRTRERQHSKEATERRESASELIGAQLLRRGTARCDRMRRSNVSDDQPPDAIRNRSRS